MDPMSHRSSPRTQRSYSPQSTRSTTITCVAEVNISIIKIVLARPSFSTADEVDQQTDDGTPEISDGHEALLAVGKETYSRHGKLSAGSGKKIILTGLRHVYQAKRWIYRSMFLFQNDERHVRQKPTSSARPIWGNIG